MWFFISDFNTKRFSDGNRRFFIKTAEFLDKFKGTNLGLDSNGFFCEFASRIDIVKFIQHLRLVAIPPFEIYALNEMYEKADKESYECRPIG